MVAANPKYTLPTQCDATSKIDHQTTKQLLIRHVLSQSVCEDVNANRAAWFLRVLDLLPREL